MKRPRKLLCFAAAILTGLIFAALPVHADTGDATLQIIDQPAKLTIQLGPGWVGTQFELRTDAGMYPEPVVVSANGLLQMDLGGSKTYTLSCLQVTPQANIAATSATNAPSTAGMTPAAVDPAPVTDAAAPYTTDVDLDDFLASLTEPGTDASAEQPAPQAAPPAAPIAGRRYVTAAPTASTMTTRTEPCCTSVSVIPSATPMHAPMPARRSQWGVWPTASCAVWVDGPGSQHDMGVGVAVLFIVDAEISTHALINKMLDIFTGGLYLVGPVKLGG